MRHLIATVSALALLGSAGIAAAQDDPAQDPMHGDVGVEDVLPDEEVRAGAPEALQDEAVQDEMHQPGDPDIVAEDLATPDEMQDLLAALNTIDANIHRLEMREQVDADQIKVVKIDKALDDPHAQAVDAAIERHQDQVTSLRDMVREHEAFSQALEDDDVSIDDVVAVDVQEDEIIVYTRS